MWWVMMIWAVLLTDMAHAAFVQWRIPSGRLIGISDRQPPDLPDTHDWVEVPGTVEEVRALLPLPAGCTALENNLYQVTSKAPFTVVVHPDLLDTDADQVTLFACERVTSFEDLIDIVGRLIQVLDASYVPGGVTLPNVAEAVSTTCDPLQVSANCAAIRTRFRTVLKQAQRAESASQADDEARLLAKVTAMRDVFLAANAARVQAGIPLPPAP